MSYPSLKKRRNDATTPPSVSFSSPQKVQRDYVISAKSVTPGKKQQSEQFLKNQESLYQQEMEALNEHTIMLMQKPSSSRAKMFLAADYLRCQRDIEALYKPAPGIVLSMGQDDCSQLGISTDNDEEEKLTIYPPTLVRNVTTRMVQVAAGGLHSLALEQGGHVYTWGCNDDGALGRVTDDDNELAQSTATLIDSKSMDAEDQGQVVQIGAGDSHSIYKTHNGNVYMSGMYKDVDSGKFRDAPPGKSCKGSNAIPTKVHKLNQPVKTVSCGASFNAAILADDSMVTWGT
jgi:alpha-tubulin suppressor-like RCC1 family protein